MHWFDTTILTLLGLGAVLGAWSGFVWQVARFVSVGAAVYGAIVFHEPASQLLQEWALRGADERVIRPVSYVIVFLAVYLSLVYTTRLVRDAIKAAHLEPFDRLLGALLGTGKTAVVLGVLCLCLASYRTPASDAILGKSTLAPYFADGMEVIVASIPEDYKTRLAETVQTLRDLTHTLQREKEREAREPEAAEKTI